MATERLKVILEMAAGQYKREAREAATSTSAIADSAEKAKTGISAFKSAAVIGGITALGRGLFSAFESAEQAASALANTEQIIRQTGGIANVTADDILELSRSLSALTGVEDEVVQEGANVLLTFKNIRNELGEGNDIFDRTAALMLDIGAVMGTDASSAALQLGKALNDPVSQMGALSRAGLTFDAQQKEQIKTLAESGNLLEAQRIILSELETQLGGTAAASADASDKIANSLGEIGEAVGTLLLRPVSVAAAELQHLVGLTNDIERFASITGQSADSATVLAGALFQVSQQHDGLADFLSVSGHEAEQFALAAEEITRQWGGTVPELQKVRDGLDFLVEGMGLSQEHADILADILDRRLAEAAAATADRIHFAKGAMEDYVPAAEDATGAADDFADAQGRQELAVDRTIDVLRDYYDLIDSKTATVDDLYDLNLRLIEAQDGVTDSIEKYGEGSPEHLAALRDLRDVNAEIRDTQADLIQQGGLTRAEFIQQQQQLGLTYSEAVLLADAYDDLFTPRSVVNTITNKITNITTDVGGGSANVDKFLASGGPAYEGGFYMTGENGRELFIPNTDGYVLNNQTTERLLSSLAGLSLAAGKAPDASYSKTGPTINLNGPINGVDEVIGAVQRANGLNAMMDLAEVYPR